MVWRVYLKNESDKPMVVVMDEKDIAPPTPVFILISQPNTKMKWTVTPPTAYPAETFGSVWEVRVPAHGIAPIIATQFRYPVPVGKYAFGCRFGAMVKVDAPGEVASPISLDSVYCTVDIPATQVSRIAGF